MGLLQAFEIWNPFRFAPDITGRSAISAFIGNPNDLAAFLVPPMLAAIAVSFAKPESRVFLISVVVLLFSALLASGSLTGIAAFGSGALAMLFLRTRRELIIGVCTIAALFALLVIIHPPLRERFIGIRTFVVKGEYDRAISNRMVAFSAAGLMSLDHPILGVGPGCFSWNYMEYRRQAEERFPALQRSDDRLLMFSEVHNDHLEVLAETGWPGYLLFLGGLVSLSSNSLRRQPPGESAERGVCRLLALPLALSLFVLALAGFPLQLAAPTVVYLYEAGLCCAWSTELSGTVQ
ncbi:MAG: O-antigen ligase family protein [Candidatus Binatia bacterium]